MLFLNNDDVKQVLTMEITMNALDKAYRELARQEAVCRPRIDIQKNAPRIELRNFLLASPPITPSLEINFFSAPCAFFARDNPNVWLRLCRAVLFVVNPILLILASALTR